MATDRSKQINEPHKYIIKYQEFVGKIAGRNRDDRFFLIFWLVIIPCLFFPKENTVNEN